MFESICVFLLFAIAAEHFEQVISKLCGNLAAADVPQVLAIVTSAAEAGFARAMYHLAEAIFGGLKPTNKLSDAESWLRRAANLGDAKAMQALGERLLDGDQVVQDSNEGRGWLGRSAAAGPPPAMRRLASRLFEAKGIQKDVGEGERWLRQAAAGYRLLDGEGVKQDQAEGVRILAECSFGGAPTIQLAWLGACDSIAVSDDIKAGPRWLMKAADAGLPRAMCILGDRHLKGDGIPRDYKKAAYWLKKATEAGDASACESYSSLLLDTNHFGDIVEEAENWLRQAAQTKMSYSLWAIPVLAERLMTGQGLRQNVDEAVDWLCRCFDRGIQPSKTIEWISALFAGDGLPMRPDLAVRLLRKGADLGQDWAMRELGFRLSKGRDLDRDPVEGANWLLRAAKKLDPASMYLYGILRLQGDVIPAHEKEGAHWLRQSAEDGFLEAMRELGNRLIEGIGVRATLPEDWNGWARPSRMSTLPLSRTWVGDYILAMGFRRTSAEGWLSRRKPPLPVTWAQKHSWRSLRWKGPVMVFWIIQPL